MLPWLAFGHILPFTELAKRIARQGHRVTLLSTPRNTRRLIHIPPDLAGLLRVVDIKLPRVEHLPEDAEASIDLPSDDLRPYLRVAYDTAFEAKLSDILREPAPERPDWILIDYAPHWAPAVAARHGVPCACVSLFVAAALSIYGPPDALMGRGKYVRTKPEQLMEVPDYVPFPTTVAYRGFEARAFFEPLLVTDDSGVSEAYRFGKCIEGSQLVGIRSSAEFESEWLQVLGELYQRPVIPIGLFPPQPTQDVGGHEATLQWLDRQPPGSVVYAAFGSEAKLTAAQLQVIALGLEASGSPFLWAFRAPVDVDEGNTGLPEGFEERVDGRGLVCRSWVPQATFLAHESVGAFLTHAGWNSTIEGLARGVRLVLLPLMFDQGLNSRLLVEKKIGVEVERDEDDGSFEPDDIAAALRKVMVEDEGEEFGTKAKELSGVFGNDEVNDQCVRDFLRRLSEYSEQHQKDTVQFQGCADLQAREVATKDVPRFLRARHPPNSDAMRIWRTNLPTKICFFAWLMYLGRHIFFDCPRSAAVWARLGITGHLMSYVMLLILWTIWKARNAVIFDHMLLPTPTPAADPKTTSSTKWTPGAQDTSNSNHTGTHGEASCAPQFSLTSLTRPPLISFVTIVGGWQTGYLTPAKWFKRCKTKRFILVPERSLRPVKRAPNRIALLAVGYSKGRGLSALEIEEGIFPLRRDALPFYRPDAPGGCALSAWCVLATPSSVAACPHPSHPQLPGSFLLGC
ncbi:hypothetical protein HU200_004625 [Digitaria exilis]|uniref:UDP-glycosyltransferase n=1 Tax=Digitaria exilis TaxID=1010633 RepID=A0A835FRP0_9POAL|nr:hypothetical protein HU200_004625 [Digitaria exilis]